MKKNLKLLMLVAAAAVGLAVMAGAPAKTITGQVAKALVEKDKAFLLDVRTPEEFAEGHIAGATNIPVQVLESRLSALPAKKDQDIVVYCRSGARSARAKAMLEAAGFTKVHDLGGMSNWEK
ncbi:MAG: rhodanese-like domain-containing protein [Myxococcota bacterium]